MVNEENYFNHPEELLDFLKKSPISFKNLLKSLDKTTEIVELAEFIWLHYYVPPFNYTRYCQIKNSGHFQWEVLLKSIKVLLLEEQDNIVGNNTVSRKGTESYVLEKEKNFFFKKSKVKGNCDCGAAHTSFPELHMFFCKEYKL